MTVFFCNIAWMEHYAGRSDRDPPLGGGSFPVTEGYCGEECNFVPCEDGFVYGHFETIQGDMDRNVLIQRIGAGRHDDFVDGIDVIWTAPTLGHDPRTVVGWYRNARVYRKRQKFSTLPRPVSEPHRIGRMDSYMVRARNENVFLLPVKQRTLNLGRGRSGWSGQTSWWYAEVTPNPEAAEFVEIVKAMMDSGKVQPITSS